MKEVYFACGGFAGGFVVCWLFVAKIKSEIAALHTKFDNTLGMLDRRVNPVR